MIVIITNITEAYCVKEIAIQLLFIFMHHSHTTIRFASSTCLASTVAMQAVII